jgi:hypothetical protein
MDMDTEYVAAMVDFGDGAGSREVRVPLGYLGRLPIEFRTPVHDRTPAKVYWATVVGWKDGKPVIRADYEPTMGT